MDLVEASEVDVSFVVTGCRVSSPSVDPAGCHIHQYLDGETHGGSSGAYGHYTTGPVTYDELTDGEHIISLQLIRNDGTDLPILPRVSDEVRINVELPEEEERTLIILTPTDDEEVSSADVEISFEVTGCDVARPSEDRAGCHIHKYLDGATYSLDSGGYGHYTADPFTMADLAPGEHTVRLVLITNDGSDDAYEPEISDLVNFTVPIADDDGDGYWTDEDCDDSDAAVHPDATEVCDGVDNDCSGDVDDGLTTLSLVVEGNLGTDADFSTTPITSGTHDLSSGTGSTLEDVTADSDLWTTTTVVDSAGTEHTLTLIFERTGTSDWSYWLLVDGGDLDGGSSGSAFSISEGDLGYDTDGSLLSFTQFHFSTTAPWSYTTASGSNIDLDAGLDSTGSPSDGDLTASAGRYGITRSDATCD
jgi:hypothetical protein